jgi:uncharacterized protein
MSAAYLIDGYNLLHALGVLAGKVSPAGLERARRRLLDYLVAAGAGEAGPVAVVFDAAGAAPRADPEQEYQGLRVEFAVGHDEADDLIELHILRADDPRHLHVISDDHRIQRAARRRQWPVLGCVDYLEWLDGRQRRRQDRAPEPPEKGGALAEGEMQHWMQVFADLADDPAFKELKGYYDFGDE